MVDPNRSTRTPLDSERPKLSAGLCREALSHSGARWRGGWHPPPSGAFSSGEKSCGQGLRMTYLVQRPGFFNMYEFFGNILVLTELLSGEVCQVSCRYLL